MQKHKKKTEGEEGGRRKSQMPPSGGELNISKHFNTNEALVIPMHAFNREIMTHYVGSINKQM